MKKSKFSEAQIQAILREGVLSSNRAEVCKKYGISVPTFYVWKSKYGVPTEAPKNADTETAAIDGILPRRSASMHANLPLRIKELEAENQLLKRLFVEMALECEALKSKTNIISSVAS